MSSIFGAIGYNDTDRVYIKTIGQQVVLDEVRKFLDRHNADLRAAYSVFVEAETDAFKERYKLPGGGYLQPRGTQARPGAVKAKGEWDVAYPLQDFGADMVFTDVEAAYLTLEELARHLKTIQAQDINTMRREILRALLDNGTWAFEDPIHGTLTIQALANGDAVLYPPVPGSDNEATENHMFGTNYAASAISDANNPFVTIRDELEEHFGLPSDGSNIVAFINNAQTPKVEALTDFVEVTDRFVRKGDDADTLVSLPANLPGRVIGRVNGVWVSEWRYMPSDYILGIHLDAPKPLKLRTDPADTGLTSNLELVSQDDESPFTDAFYRHRYGFGVSNRLNGVALQLVASTSYNVPAGFDRG